MSHPTGEAFRAAVLGKDIDALRFDEAGLIADFREPVRPLRGLGALVAAMAAALGG